MIVIVMGLPGSGKTNFAQSLAEKLNVKYLGTDRIREVLNVRGKYNLPEKLYVYDWLANITEGALNEGKKVVVEGTFYLHRTRDLFQRIAQSKNIPIKYILLESPEWLIKQRLESPSKVSEADFPVYLKIKKEFEKMTEPCLQLISDSDNIDTMLSSALEFIEEQRNEMV